MKRNDERIALRLPSKQRCAIEELVLKGKFRNQSNLIREAIEQFLRIHE